MGWVKWFYFAKAFINTLGLTSATNVDVSLRDAYFLLSGYLTYYFPFLEQLENEHFLILIITPISKLHVWEFQQFLIFLCKSAFSLTFVIVCLSGEAIVVFFLCLSTEFPIVSCFSSETPVHVFFFIGKILCILFVRFDLFLNNRNP